MDEGLFTASSKEMAKTGRVAISASDLPAPRVIETRTVLSTPFCPSHEGYDELQRNQYKI